MNTTEQRVRDALAKQHGIPAHSIDLAASLHNLSPNRAVDSLDAIETIFFLEDEFGIEISDCDAENLHTVQQVIDYCSKPQLIRQRPVFN